MFSPFIGVGLSGALYVIVLPILLLQFLALLFVPSLLSPGARPANVGKAVYCYLLQAFGIAMMTLGGLPALYAVLEKFLTGYDRFSTEIYIALLVVFAAGGLTYLWHERMAGNIDEASARVPSTLYVFTFKLMGFVLMLFSALSFLLTMLLVRESFTGTWWIMPVLLFLYGVLLSWCTRFPTAAPQQFQSAPMRTAAAPATKAEPKKAVAKKSPGKKKELSL